VRVSTWRRALAALVAAGLAVLGGCAPAAGNTALPHMRVLFIGNSFTYYNNGIDQVLRGLAPNTEVDSATKGGYRLSDHLGDTATMDKLRNGNWTAVVIQEQSQTSVWSPADFTSAATTMVAEVRKTGARPLLLATWARPDSTGITTTALNSAFTRAGKRLGVPVVPAGNAFGASLAAHPEIVLNQADGHPTPAGTYLAGCVVYSSLFSVSPVGDTFSGLDAGVASVLQQAAATATGR
jgi:hypothetical protein